MIEYFCRMFDMLKAPGVALLALLLAAWCVRELTLFLRRVGVRGSAVLVLSGLAFAAMWCGGGKRGSSARAGTGTRGGARRHLPLHGGGVLERDGARCDGLDERRLSRGDADRLPLGDELCGRRVAVAGGAAGCGGGDELGACLRVVGVEPFRARGAASRAVGRARFGPRRTAGRMGMAPWTGGGHGRAGRPRRRRTDQPA